MLSESGSGPGDAPASPAVEPEAPAPSEAAPKPEASVEGPVTTPAKTPWWWRRYTFTGTAVGLVFVWLSMTPSLLPRGPLFQGLVSGVSGAIGYALGVLAVWLVRYMRAKTPARPHRGSPGLCSSSPAWWARSR
jgi:uncharacterized membrane protein